MKIRVALSILAGVLAVYFAARAVIAPRAEPTPMLVAASVAIFLAATAVALFAPDRVSADPSPGRMPRWVAAAACIGAASLPFVATAGQPLGQNLAAPDTTWFIGAGGVVFAVVCARRRPIAAWAGIAVFSVATIVVFRSVGDAFVAGLLGSLVWVGVAQLVVVFTDQAYRDTARLARIQQESASWRRAQEVRRSERRERVRAAIGIAGPVLSRVIETSGRLSDSERDEAVIAEATLRDELRGAKLLDGSVRTALLERRRSGTTVTLFDEGGLDDLGAPALEPVRRELAHVLRATSAEHVIVRTSHLPDTAVTVVGRDADDEVELWSEIRRPEGDPGRRARPGS